MEASKGTETLMGATAASTLPASSDDGKDAKIRHRGSNVDMETLGETVLIL